MLCQVLTDNSDAPFEHLRPEDGVDDATVPVHPFQQRIVQLDSTPPSVLARCIAPLPITFTIVHYCRLYVLLAQLVCQVIFAWYYSLTC